MTQTIICWIGGDGRGKLSHPMGREGYETLGAIYTRLIAKPAIGRGMRSDE